MLCAILRRAPVTRSHYFNRSSTRARTQNLVTKTKNTKSEIMPDRGRSRLRRVGFRLCPGGSHAMVLAGSKESCRKGRPREWRKRSLGSLRDLNCLSGNYEVLIEPNDFACCKSDGDSFQTSISNKTKINISVRKGTSSTFNNVKHSNSEKKGGGKKASAIGDEYFPAS